VATRFTDLVGCRLPIQLAAMGGVGTTELAAVVIGAGGFGMVNRRTEPAPGACGKNFLVPFDPDMEEVREAAGRARVVEFFYGDPDAKLVDAVHSGGALAAWQVGSAAEAAAAVETGCDFVAGSTRPTGCCALPKLPPGRAVGVRPHRRPGTSTVRSRTWRCTRAPALGTFDRCSPPRRLSPTSSGCCPDAQR